jgi:uncharacterized protein
MSSIRTEPITLQPLRPVERAIMTQGWFNLTYVHWRYDPSLVQRLLPAGFRVDTIEGDAWVGVIPFEMQDISFPIGAARVPTGRFGTFPETNVRTYIVDPLGRRGVWFFSLDIDRLTPTLVARVGYGLPYCFAKMTASTRTTGETSVVRYTSYRRWPRHQHKAMTSSSIEVRTGSPIVVHEDSVDAFTTARWALGSTWAKRPMWAEVDHPTWALHQATLTEYDESLIAAAGLPQPIGEPLVRWSPGVEVRIARPRMVMRTR